MTYEVEILRYVVAEDCGRVINPLVADGQVHGGVAQGIGAALYEEMVHDRSGQALSATFVDYLVPSAAEIPPIEVEHLETPAENNLGGFRGIGEGGTIGAPAAIANAVADALDIEIGVLPATPERLFRLDPERQERTAGSPGGGGRQESVRLSRKAPAPGRSAGSGPTAPAPPPRGPRP